jgi:hypothetical protein
MAFMAPVLPPYTETRSKTMSFNPETLIHDLILLCSLAASIFVKNPASQQHAAELIDAVNTHLLPLIDKATGKAITSGS